MSPQINALFSKSKSRTKALLETWIPAMAQLCKCPKSWSETEEREIHWIGLGVRVPRIWFYFTSVPPSL